MSPYMYYIYVAGNPFYILISDFENVGVENMMMRMTKKEKIFKRQKMSLYSPTGQQPFLIFSNRNLLFEDTDENVEMVLEGWFYNYK